MAHLKKLLAAASAVVLTAGLAACSSDSADKTVKLGVVGASDPFWADYEKAVEAEGIDLEIVDFGEYSLPNPALAAGEIDVNQFQHILFLANHNAESGDDLTTIGSTAIFPLGLYSKKHKSVEDIPEGATVGIPNDGSNRGRGLLVLQSAGLIKLKDGGNPFSTANDVIEAESKVKVKELDAAQLAPALEDLDAAIINNDFIGNAGLEAKDAIAKDDPADPVSFPYVNIFAVKKGEEDNPTYLKLVEVFQNTQKVLDGVQEVSGGTAHFVKIDNKELQASLENTVKDLKASK